MAGFRIAMLIMQIISALLLIGLSIPLIRRMVPPNHWYGFRVPRTLRDPVVWYEANAYSGRCLLGAGVAILVGGVSLYAVPTLDGPAYATACAVVALGALAVAVILSFRFLGRIARPTDV
jgi:uncharacterized membrane protein